MILLNEDFFQILNDRFEASQNRISALFQILPLSSSTGLLRVCWGLNELLIVWKLDSLLNVRMLACWLAYLVLECRLTWWVEVVHRLLSKIYAVLRRVVHWLWLIVPSHRVMIASMSILLLVQLLHIHLLPILIIKTRFASCSSRLFAGTCYLIAINLRWIFAFVRLFLSLRSWRRLLLICCGRWLWVLIRFECLFSGNFHVLNLLKLLKLLLKELVF